MSAETEKMQTNPQWLSRGLWAEGVAAVALMVGLFGLIPYNFGFESQPVPVFTMLKRFWTAPEMADWHHGMMVPFISFGLVIYQWKDLQKVSIRPCVWGAGVVLAGLGLYWIGYKVDITIVGFMSLQLMIGGLILWLLGWDMMKALAFPYMFLMFAYPFYFLDNIISFPLRGVMCQLSQGFLNLIGVDTMRVGTALVSAPDYASGLKQGERFALDVANPCSGIRSLFALMMVSALYAHLTLGKTWQKLALFALSPALAVAGNFARMLMLTFGTILLGSGVAIGTEENPTTYHMAAGFFVFVVALGGMVAVGWVLQGGLAKAWKKWNTPVEIPGAPKS
jgi:exosortase